MIEIFICEEVPSDLAREVELVREIMEKEDVEYHISTFTEAYEQLFDAERIHIVIMDVAIQKFSGINIGRKLREKFLGLKLIYATNHKEYAMEAVNYVHAYAFLDKPLKYEELRQQIVSALVSIQNANRRSRPIFIDMSEEDKKTDRKHFVSNVIDKIAWWKYTGK